MQTPGWYLVAYDITEPKRLRRVHRYLRQHGLSVQESLFFLCRTEAGLVDLLDDLAALIHLGRDDLRAYPVEHPSRVWLSGSAPVEGALLRPGSAPHPNVDKSPDAAAKKSLMRRLWGKRHER